jgi:HSP20 family protein
MMVSVRTTRDNQNSLIESRLSQFFNDALGAFDWRYRDAATAAWVPPVDITEQGDAIRIAAELPGVSPDNVKISVENNVLTIHGTKEQVEEEKTERVHRYERTYGSFERTFTLPGTVDPAAIRAAYDNGVLTVTLPKVEKAKPRQIQVEVAKR